MQWQGYPSTGNAFLNKGEGTEKLEARKRKWNAAGFCADRRVPGVGTDKHFFTGGGKERKWGQGGGMEVGVQWREKTEEENKPLFSPEGGRQHECQAFEV